jgi:hypothetical protein
MTDNQSFIVFCIPPAMLDCIPFMVMLLSSHPRMADAHALTVFLIHPTIELADALSVIVFDPPHPINDLLMADHVIVLYSPHTILSHRLPLLLLLFRLIRLNIPPTMFELDVDHSILFCSPHTILFLYRAWIVFNTPHQIKLLSHCTVFHSPPTIILDHPACKLFCCPHNIEEKLFIFPIILVVFPKTTLPDTCNGTVGFCMPIPTCP